VKKAWPRTEAAAVDGEMVTLRLKGETRTAIEDRREHGLEMRLLGKATFELAKGRFRTFELVAMGSRWGGTQFNARGGDMAAALIRILLTLATDSPWERVAPALTRHPVSFCTVAATLSRTSKRGPRKLYTHHSRGIGSWIP
jgi:hypothetical protein